VIFPYNHLLNQGDTGLEYRPSPRNRMVAVAAWTFIHIIDDRAGVDLFLFILPGTAKLDLWRRLAKNGVVRRL